MLDLGLLLAQLVVILLAARLAGVLVRPLGQPPVVGEMIAGLALGPSLLGAVAPGALAALFPRDRMLPLAALSQLGVLLYMFVVGLRLDLTLLRGRAHAAVAVSHASIIAPFLLGAALAPLLHPELAPAGVGLLPFTLFLGAAMSVTAFPVLARILDERGLQGTRIGAVALSAAAVDDVTAWCILAAVVAVAQASSAGAAGGGGLSAFLTTIGWAAAWVLVLLFAVRPLLARIVARWPGTVPSPQLVSVAVVGALISAWATEHAGVHALFGSFVAGVIVPRVVASRAGGSAPGAPSPTLVPAARPAGPPPANLPELLADRIEAVVGAVLLPVFFAFTGLRMSVGLVQGGTAWALTGLVLLVAVAGKMGGSAGAARLLGMPWREALAVGALMNTRGLMELVILNVGLDIGVITPTLFAMLVIMALVTTVMTAPLLTLLRQTHRLDRQPASTTCRAPPASAWSRAAVRRPATWPPTTPCPPRWSAGLLHRAPRRRSPSPSPPGSMEGGSPVPRMDPPMESWA
jgi:Kef-type K+ transport system membrane component KefB